MKILVLGIGNAQVDLIKLLSQSHTVHAISYSSDGRGLEFTDYFNVIDIKDEDAVENYARKHAIDLIYSIGSDLAMITAAKVSHKLGLPSFVTPGAASICHNKHLLRAHLEDTQGNIDHKMLEHPNEIDGFGFPCMMKPVDSQGQRGVYLIQDEKELKDKFSKVLQFSESGAIIAEQYIEGPEVSVNAYVLEGEIKFSIISDRIVWPNYPGGLIHKHQIPSQFVNNESRTRINNLIRDVIKKISIGNGPVYFQIKLEDNMPKLIEVTPRLDGCHIWRLINYAVGVNLLQTTVDHLLYNNIKNLNFKNPENEWTLEFMCAEPQTVIDKDSYNLYNLHYHEWYYDKGDTVGSINTYWEKCGYKIYNI